MKNILIIEDDSSLCMLLNHILGKSYKVNAVSNGMDAICALVDGSQPDVIISDMMMPSMDGLELLENLKLNGLFRDIPVVILSGMEDPFRKRRCEELGVHAFLSKPFKPKSLIDTIENAIGTQKPEYYA
jgi:two-component system chemotaxis response regulator CheY